jgi:tetratricopeptide (TPR) repeat protein
LNNLAMLLSRDSTKLDDAVSLAQKAKELAPQSPYVLDTLGWIYYRKGLYSLAAVELERAVGDAQRPTSQYHLGLTYNRLGDTTKGGRLIAAALAKEPKLADTEIP